MIRDDLAASLRIALEKVGVEPPATITSSGRRRREHGDWSSNVALATAKPAGRNPRELGHRARRAPDGRSAAPTSTRVEVAGAGFVNFHLRADLAARRAARRWSTRARPTSPGSTFGDRRAGAGRVRVGQPDRADPRRQRLVRVLRRLAGPPARAVRLRRSPRVLRQRHRRADPPPGRVGAGPPGGRARARGRLPQRVRQGAGQSPTTAPTTSSRPGGGRPSTSSGSSARRWRRCNIHFDEWFSQASIEESEALVDTIALLQQTGPACGRRTAPSGSTPGPIRRPPREAGAAQVGRPGRRLHVPGRRHRLPPQQVPGPRVRPGHQRVGRRPPGPGRQPAGRRRAPSGSSRVGSRCASARWCRWPAAASASASATPSTSTTWSTTSAPTSCACCPSSRRSTRRRPSTSTRCAAESRESPVFYVQYAHARIHSIGKKAGEAGRGARADSPTSTCRS